MKPLNPVRTVSLLFIAISLLLLGCNDTPTRTAKSQQKIIQSEGRLFEVQEAHTMLAAAFPLPDTMKGIANIRAAMPYVYSKSGYKPIWITEAGISEDTRQLLADLDSLRSDGIEPERYHLSSLSASFQKLRSGGNISEAIAFDTACTRAYLQASYDLLFGLLIPRKADSLWFHDNDSSWNAPQLLAAIANDGSYPALSAFRSAIPTYASLQAAYARHKSLAGDEQFRNLQEQVDGKATPDSVALAIVQKQLPWFQPQGGDSLSPAAQAIRELQAYFGAVATGKMDSATAVLLRMRPDTIACRIAANMERLRWLPQSLEAQHVLVNIPLMELFFRKDGSDVFHMRVVVGRPSRQTPSLNAAMANVVFSPSWGVPPTILKKDVLPGFSKSGAAYLKRKGLRLYDRRGHQVSAVAVKAKNLRNYTLKQPPGARNALGEVKFNLPNRWDIYLHDTPHREDFPKRYRAKSSGCVRVEKPREFAEFILRDIEGRERFDQSTIDSIIQTRKTRYEILKTKIPVHIVYLTVLEDSMGNHMRLVPDIYGRDRKLMAMLAQQ